MSRITLQIKNMLRDIKMRQLAHSLLAARARAAGVKVDQNVMLSHGGTYLLDKTAEVVIESTCSILKNHHIEASEGSRIHIERGVNFRAGVKLYAGPGANIRIEEGCFFNHDVSIVALNEVVIGRNSIFGPYSYINDHNHQFALGVLIKDQGYDTLPLHVGSDVWLGVGATLIRGAALGNGCIIAARAVVNKSVPCNEIWGGIPARRIGARQ